MHRKGKPDLIHKQNGANGILNSFHLEVFLKRSIRILDTQMQKFSSVTVRWQIHRKKLGTKNGMKKKER